MIYIRKPLECEIIQFKCTPDCINILKEKLKESLGPITKPIDSFSKAMLKIDYKGIRITVLEDNYIVINPIEGIYVITQEQLDNLFEIKDKNNES